MREFGGCLHFEIGKGNELYYEYEDAMVRLISGRSALLYILQTKKFNKIYLPEYNCPFVANAVKMYSDTPVALYGMDDDFQPVGINPDDDEIVLWINYFGTMYDDIVAKMKKYHCNMIIDNSHAFFSPPDLSVYTIYSCRKFIGVADGAYVIKRNIPQISLPDSFAAERYMFLLSAIEAGSNFAYSGYKQNEDFFNGSIQSMSALTRKVLSGINYEDIKSIRQRNFNILHNGLRQINKLDCNYNSDTPIAYPLLTYNDNLRSVLLENNVFTPTWWRHCIKNDIAGKFEKQLAKYLIPLPIDQRYSSEDMETLLNIVLESL